MTYSRVPLPRAWRKAWQRLARKARRVGFRVPPIRVEAWDGLKCDRDAVLGLTWRSRGRLVVQLDLNDDDRNATMAHELAHAIASQMVNDNHPHHAVTWGAVYGIVYSVTYRFAVEGAK